MRIPSNLCQGAKKDKIFSKDRVIIIILVHVKVVKMTRGSRKYFFTILFSPFDAIHYRFTWQSIFFWTFTSWVFMNWNSATMGERWHKFPARRYCSSWIDFVIIILCSRCLWPIACHTQTHIIPGNGLISVYMQILRTPANVPLTR